MKKLFAAIISLTLLCSCGTSDNVETETNTVSNTAISVSEASETALTSENEEISVHTSANTEPQTEAESFSETSETVLTSEKNESSAYTSVSTESATKSETPVSKSQTESSAEASKTEQLPLESGYCAFDDVKLLSESEIITLAEKVRGGFKQSDFVKDHTEFDDMGIPFGGSYDIMIVPVDADFEEYCADEKNFPMYYEEEYENGVLEKLGENDIYSQWRNAYTEIRRMYRNDVPTVLELDREYRRVFLKNFVRNKNNSFVYTGKMNVDDIMRNFDIFTYSPPGMKICRRVVESNDSFTYEFYCVRIVGGDWGLDDEAVIEGKSIEISKKDGSFNSGGKKFYEAGYEIPNTAPHTDWEWDD